jgi:hypothetical protein
VTFRGSECSSPVLLAAESERAKEPSAPKEGTGALFLVSANGELCGFSMHRVADSGTEFRLTTVLSLVSEFILDLDELFDVTSCGLWLVKLTAGVLFLFNVKRDMVASGTM